MTHAHEGAAAALAVAAEAEAASREAVLHQAVAFRMAADSAAAGSKPPKAAVGNRRKLARVPPRARPPRTRGSGKTP